MWETIRVAVIMGGMSGEHEVSLKSGRGILANLDPNRYAGRKVVVGLDGQWRVDDGPPQPMLKALMALSGEVDVAFLALHGPNGEDGTMQSVLQLLGLPYTGSDHYASSLAMNKPRAKDVYAAAGLDTPPYQEVTADELRSRNGGVVDDLIDRFGLPLVVKTPRLGSSVGVDVVTEREALVRRLDEFMRYSGQVMVEQFVAGKEITSPVLDDPATGRTVALPLIEIRPRVSPWFDYRAKYELGGSDELCPAPIEEALAQRCRNVGLTAHRALGCRGMSRTDMLVDEGGRIFVIETNTIPGFTETSLLPQAARAAGIAYPQLVDMLIREALDRQGR